MKKKKEKVTGLERKKAEIRKVKAEYNIIRMSQNALVESLTPAQHNALLILSKYRHDLHTNTDHFFALDTLEAARTKRFFCFTAETMLRSALLPPLNVSDYFLMPDKEFADAVGLTGEFRELAKESCRSRISKVNQAVECYLRYIDKTYKTRYCPTGSQRGEFDIYEDRECSDRLEAV